MFNAEVKKENFKKLESAISEYKSKIKIIEEKSIMLHYVRNDASKLIKQIEGYVNTLSNSPKGFYSTIEEIKINAEKFNVLLDIKTEDDKSHKISGGIAGGGVAMGVGVAAFAPTAAMAIATTFGVASTGTAISALGGAAATNAALAWLGGGALVAGGGGIAAGEGLLALAGPIGWAIGGAALIGGGIMVNEKNKKLAEKAMEEAVKINKENAKLIAIYNEIDEIRKLTLQQMEGVNKQYAIFSKNNVKDYRAFTDDEKYEIGAMINNTLSLSKLLNRKVG